VTEPTTDVPAEAPAPAPTRRTRRAAATAAPADQAAHAVAADPNDPRIGTTIAVGSEFVSYPDGEYQVDPSTGTILARIN